MIVAKSLAFDCSNVNELMEVISKEREDGFMVRSIDYHHSDLSGKNMSANVTFEKEIEYDG